MSGLTCQRIVFVTKLVQTNCFRPPSSGINADGGYVLASRVSVDFPESDLLQFFYRYQRLVHTVLRFHVIAAQQPVATVSLRKRGRRTASLHQGFRPKAPDERAEIMTVPGTFRNCRLPR